MELLYDVQMDCISPLSVQLDVLMKSQLGKTHWALEWDLWVTQWNQTWRPMESQSPCAVFHAMSMMQSSWLSPIENYEGELSNWLILV